MRTQRYRRAHRLRGRRQYSAVFRQGKRFYTRGLVVVARANGLPYMRFGLSVRKKIGKAVVRTRVKRVLRESFRSAPHRSEGGLDLVAVPQEAAELRELRVRLARLIKAACRHRAAEER